MKNILIIVIAAVVGVVGGGVGGYFLASKLNPANQVVEEEVAFDLQNGSSLALNDMTIALKKSGSKSSFLKASFVIVFEDAETLAIAENMTDYYRDAILSVFEDKTADDLNIAGRNEMKEPILEAVRGLYNNEEDREKIVAVMIPSFIVT